MNSGPVILLDRDQRAERHLAAVGAAHVELVDVCDVGARSAFRFDVGLPLAAEAIEVIHQIAAHEGLHRGVDAGKTHLLLQGLFLIDIGVELGHGGLIGRDGGRDLRTLGKRPEKCEDVLSQCRRDRLSRSDLRGSW